MHVDLVAMGKELGGIRPDSLRIILGQPTRLQKLIRGAKSFMELASLKGEFPSENSSRDSCGPKHEPEELLEYQARRLELFPEYVEQFDTLEKFKQFGRLVSSADTISLYEEESTIASAKFQSLVDERIEEIRGNLEKLLEFLHWLKATPRWGNYHMFAEIYAEIKKCLSSELLRMKNTKGRAILIKKMPGYYDLFKGGEGVKKERSKWSFVWLDVRSFREYLLLRDINGELIDHDVLDQHMSKVLERKISRLKKFPDKLKYVVILLEPLEKQSGVESKLYSYVLIGLARMAESIQEIESLILAWGKRFDRNQGTLKLNPAIKEVWDKFHVPLVEHEEGLKELAGLLNRSIPGSRTESIARKKLDDHFQAKLEKATTVAEIQALEKEAKELSDRIWFHPYSRIQGIQKEERRKNLERRWEMVMGGNSPDEKRDLISLYHELKDDEESRKKILLRLLPFFPAESLDLEVVEQG